MNLIKYASERNLTNEKFLSELGELHNHYEVASRGQQQLMFVVGKVNAFKNNYPRQSSEWKFYQHILDELNVSKDQSSELTRAYNYYNELLEMNVDEYRMVAENATPHQLLALSYGKKETTLYDAAQFLKTNKRLPSVNKIKARNCGWVSAKFTDNRFEKLPENRTDTKLKTEPTLYVAPKPLSPEEQEFERQLTLNRVSSDMDRSYIKSQISNDNLPFINTAAKALLWRTDNSSCEVSLAVLEQKMSQSEGFAEQVMNLAAKYSQPKNSEDVTNAVVEVKASAPVFDNKERNGVRWRR